MAQDEWSRPTTPKSSAEDYIKALAGNSLILYQGNQPKAVVAGAPDTDARWNAASIHYSPNPRPWILPGPTQQTIGRVKPYGNYRGDRPITVSYKPTVAARIEGEVGQALFGGLPAQHDQ